MYYIYIFGHGLKMPLMVVLSYLLIQYYLKIIHISSDRRYFIPTITILHVRLTNT
jgi:hypothetical protein